MRTPEGLTGSAGAMLESNWVRVCELEERSLNVSHCCRTQTDSEKRNKQVSQPTVTSHGYPASSASAPPGTSPCVLWWGRRWWSYNWVTLRSSLRIKCKSSQSKKKEEFWVWVKRVGTSLLWFISGHVWFSEGMEGDLLGVTSTGDDE